MECQSSCDWSQLNPKINVDGAVECQSSCDWSQPSVGGAMECHLSCDWSQPSADDTVDDRGYDRVKFCGDESLQSMDADDEHGSSSSSDEDWQEVEGLCVLLVYFA